MLTMTDIALLTLLAILIVVLFLGFLDSGPVCSACGWAENHCSESRHYSRRPCCARCSHDRLDRPEPPDSPPAMGSC